jgi:hypothetical protein
VTDRDDASTIAGFLHYGAEYECGIGATLKAINIGAYRTKYWKFAREETATWLGVLVGGVAAFKFSVTNVVAENRIGVWQSHAEYEMAASRGAMT